MKTLLLGLIYISFCCPAFSDQSQWGSGEYSVTFGSKPEQSEVGGVIDGSIVTTLTAICQSGEVAEKAESTPTPHSNITKDLAYKAALAWANSFSLKDTQMQFSDANPSDRTLTLMGSKTIQTSTIAVNMRLTAVFHWGFRNAFVVWVAEPTINYPSREAQRFISSVRHKD